MQETQKFLIFGSQKRISKFLEIENVENILKVLIEISAAVQKTGNLDELYKSIHRSLGKVLNVDNFFIASYNEEKDSVSFPYYVDKIDSEKPSEITNFSKTRFLTAKILKKSEPRILFSRELAKIQQENLIPIKL